ncbi:MAG: CsbD family protein [Actinomycetota bacterium]|nr:CsbD family protein [Actinomycetota bacterium]
MGYEDKTSNKVDDLAGKTKEGLGRATGDDKLEAEGKTDQGKSDVKEQARKLKDKAEGMGRSVSDG